MKKIAILILGTVLISISVLANGEKSENIQTQDPQSITIQQLPYSSTGLVVMEEVIRKDEYSLYKCPSSYVTNFPGKSITGIHYNYFVYKNGNFHMTVNDNNKSDVFNFLTN